MFRSDTRKIFLKFFYCVIISMTLFEALTCVCTEINIFIYLFHVYTSVPRKKIK